MSREDQHPPDLHLSDEELLQAADGELSARRAAQVHAHLAACWDCRARMAEIEGTIADFARAHRQALDPQLPPIDGPRALLRAQLAELTAQPQPSSWPWIHQFKSPWPAMAFIGAGVLIVVAAGGYFLQHSKRPASNPAFVSSERGAKPDHRLTPGATRNVAISDVCAMAHEEVVSEVSAPLRQAVFQEYGIGDARASDYEVDYLIAPGLGGVEEIHNLWPEPYTSPTWNAHVKDALEERLHDMVCAGQLDLSTAQRDISTDWIAAYKKYFNTDRPLSMRSDLIQDIQDGAALHALTD